MSTSIDAALVRTVWAEVVDLDVDKLADDDDFFAVGGHSITAALVARKVGRATGLHVPPRALFEHPTIEGLLRFLQRQRAAAPTIPPRRDPHEHPLGSGQERQWLLNQRHPERTTYTVPTIVELVGPLDRAALDVALTTLAARHEPLRTIVVDDASGPRARVLPPGPVAVETVDADPDTATAVVDAFLRRPFALDREPPLRVQLVRLAPDRHRLVIAVHHIAFDGDAQRIVLAELGALYSGRRLVPVGVGYGDLAAWRAGLPRPVGTADEDGLAVLRGLRDQPLALEGPDPDAATGVGARHVRCLSPRLTATVRACANAHRTTVFVALLAAFSDIVARWSDSTDVCVGYPLSVREPEAARDLVGFFAETCLVRVDLADRPSYGTVVDRVHAHVVAATSRVTPFDVLTEAAAARGERMPLFRTWFNHLGAPLQPPQMAGLRTTVLDAPTPAALFDLNMYVVETNDDIRVEVVRDVAVASAAAVEQLLDQYLALLAHAVASVDAQLRYRPTLPTLPDPAADLRGDAAPSLARRLVAVARARPDATATGTLTYQALHAAVRAFAAAVRGAGLPRGATVAVLARRDADLAVAMLGVWAAGGRLLLLDPAHPPARLADHLATAGADWLVDCGLPDGVPAALDDPRRAFVRLRDGHVEVVRGGGAARRGDGPGYVAFTSGSTGTPAGVAGTIGPIEHFLHWYSERCALVAADRFALLAGLSHDPVFRDVLLPLWNGATLCVPPPEVARVPAELVGWLRDERVTVVNLTPALARLLAAEQIPLPALRVVCISGDAVAVADTARLADLAPHATLLQGYGTTETPQLVSLCNLTPGTHPSLGTDVPGAQLLVVDEVGERCGVGEAGRIVVRSRHLAAPLLSGADGYAARAWADDPVPGVRRFATGDLGRYRAEGGIAFLGRDDDVVNIRGFRVHPAETDRAITADPRVSASCTVAHTDPTDPDGAELVSYVVADGPTPAQIRTRLAGLLPSYLVPAAVVPLARLPLTANGKVDRAALPLPRCPAGGSPPTTPPRDAVEERLATLLSGILGTPEVDVTETFFDLGAASLHLLRLHSAIRRQFGAEVPLLALYESPTVRSLAGRLSGDAGPAADGTAGAGSQSVQVRGSRSEERARRLAARRGVQAAGQR